MLVRFQFAVDVMETQLQGRLFLFQRRFALLRGGQQIGALHHFRPFVRQQAILLRQRQPGVAQRATVGDVGTTLAALTLEAPMPTPPNASGGDATLTHFDEDDARRACGGAVWTD